MYDLIDFQYLIDWLGSVNTTEANTRIPTNTGSFVTANEVCINSEADGATKVTTNTSSYTTIDDKPSSPGSLEYGVVY